MVLPPAYESSQRRYPVLYLLHGLSQNEDSWLVFTDLIDHVAAQPPSRQAIVVVPRLDSTGIELDARDGSRQGERFLAERLVDHVDSTYRTLADSSQRAIAGVSAGALTATVVAAHRPDAFAAVGSFSGVPDGFFAGPASLAVFFALERAITVSYGGDPTGVGVVGDPVRDELWYRDSNAADLVHHFAASALYVSSGDGTPCDARDARDLAQPPSTAGLAYQAVVEPFQRASTESFVRTAAAAGVAHVARLGCGIHAWRHWEADLHAFWPQMASAFGRPAPATFEHRRALPRFSVWGWTFEADPRRAPEFLYARDVSRDGLELTGSGTTGVTTPPLFEPGASVLVRSDDGRETLVTADGSGRARFKADLGPPHREQQYTARQQLEADDDYFTVRRLTLEALR